MKSRRPQFFFVALMAWAVLLSCGKPRQEIPQGVLTEKEMVPVLVDVHIAQAASGLYKAGDSVRYTMNDLLPYILSVHHIDKAVYDSSISFYTRHPEIMQKLYDDVIIELSRKQGEASSK